MRKVIAVALLGGFLFSLLGYQVQAQSTETRLELTVYMVESNDGETYISEPGSAELDFYDNLGEELLTSQRASSTGKVTITLDDRFPLSGKGLYHTLVVVDDVSNGVVTCQQGTTCQVTVFSVNGLDPDHEDALLIVNVVRSDDLITPVEDVQVNVWPADAEGRPLTNAQYRTASGTLIEYNGTPCVSNANGYCAVHLEQVYRWEENKYRIPITNTVVKFGSETLYDASFNWVLEGSLMTVKVAVDGDGKLDDCTFKSPPSRGVLSQSCLHKVHQTATAQAELSVDPEVRSVANAAVVQASLLSKDTAELFAAHEPDQAKIAEFLAGAGKLVSDSANQVKLILSVEEITNDGYNAFISGPAIGDSVEVTSPDDPDELLGACEVNRLGECITILDRSDLMAPDGFLKFRVLADGYDNGILLCKDETICEQHAYTAMRFLGKTDAVLLYKVLNEDDYWKPVPEVFISAGVKRIEYQIWFWSYTQILYDTSEFSRGCVADINGACPIYVGETGFTWKSDDQGDYSIPLIYVTGGEGNDTILPYPRDDRLVVYPIAVNLSGQLIDCTFSSPLTYQQTSPLCSAKKSALQTAIAGYTATPTITVTPTVTLTPTVTATPLPSATPTATLIPTPTPKPGLFAGESAPLAIGGIALLIVLLGGGAWVILRTRNKRS
jgi:hypothetical protein